MENLPSYVDLSDYCTELSQITNVSIEDVKAVVFCVFGFINEGLIESYRGFLIIEAQLTEKMKECQNQNKMVLA